MTLDRWIRTVAILLVALLAGWLVYDRYIAWRLEPLVSLLAYVPVDRVSACLCAPDREVNINREDGLRIAGSLYGLGNGRTRPAVLIIHGNTPLGRKLAIYRVLAQGLAARGFVVFTIDRTGAEESGNPYAIGDEKALDPVLDTSAALRYLASLGAVDRNRISIVGHSGGAIAALRAAMADPLVQKVVAIGPPRRVQERFGAPEERDRFWKRKKEKYRFVYGEKFPAWFSKEIWLRVALKYNAMENYLDYLRQPDHKPLFLIDGELEDEADRHYLKEFADSIAPPKEYMTLEDSDHYLNATEVSRINFYDREVMDKAVTDISDWLLHGAVNHSGTASETVGSN